MPHAFHRSALALAVALSLGLAACDKPASKTATAASAQPGVGYDRRDDRDHRVGGYVPRDYVSRGGNWRDHRGREWRYDRGWYDRYRVQTWRYDRGRYYARNRYSIGYYSPPPRFVVRLWVTGDRLPSSYYERRYLISDYWRFDLYEPPYWAHWVRVRNDALLIDRDTGEVLDVVYDLYW